MKGELKFYQIFFSKNATGVKIRLYFRPTEIIKAAYICKYCRFVRILFILK